MDYRATVSQITIFTERSAPDGTHRGAGLMLNNPAWVLSRRRILIPGTGSRSGGWAATDYGPCTWRLITTTPR